MMELWKDDKFIDIIAEEAWSYYAEIGGYHFIWCEGYGP